MFNDLATIENARQIKRDARQMRDAIAELDVFQSVFNMPCWLSDSEMFQCILDWISAPDSMVLQ